MRISDWSSDVCSSDLFEAEREAIYRRCWLYMVRAEELPALGDYVVKDVEICGASVLIVRGQDDALRAFHNVCRHRGMPVADSACGKAAAFRCPYQDRKSTRLNSSH